MKTKKWNANETTINRLHEQGYTNYSNEQLQQYIYGIRFAYWGCGFVVAIAIILQSTLILQMALSIALMAVILPYHPLDYLYNSFLHRIIAKPKIPRRPHQSKFACAVATAWLVIVLILFQQGSILIANVLAIILVSQALIVGTIDYCIPSKIYNYARQKLRSFKQQSSEPTLADKKHWTVLLLLIYLVGMNHNSSAQTKVQDSGAHIGISAPGFLLADTEGQMISSDQFKDKFTVIHFATTWCPFCNAEAPHLEKLYQEYQAKGVEVLIIDVKESQSLVSRQITERFNLSFPVLLDVDGSVAASFAPSSVLPELSRDEVMLASNLVIAPGGKIIFFSLLDTTNFDATLVQLKSKLNEYL